MKILRISKCRECPHIIHDAQHIMEFWGKDGCFRDPKNPVLIAVDADKEIPDNCPLENADG